MPNIFFAAHSISGRREVNQDACFAGELAKNVTLLAVADGMGGVEAGEIASQLAIDTLRANIEKINWQEPDIELKKILAAAFEDCQTQLRELIVRSPELKGTGTTLTGVLIVDDRFAIANIGDSRTYLLQDGNLRQITTDHSLVAQFEMQNGIKADDASLKKYGHYVTKAIDGGSDTPDLFPAEAPFFQLNGDTVLLLCSDGLILDKRGTEIDRLRPALTDFSSPLEAAGHLVQDALDRGSQDNITAVIAACYSSTSQPLKEYYSNTNTSHVEPVIRGPVTTASNSRSLFSYLVGTILLLIGIILGYLLHQPVGLLLSAHSLQKVSSWLPSENLHTSYRLGDEIMTWDIPKHLEGQIESCTMTFGSFSIEVDKPFKTAKLDANLKEAIENRHPLTLKFRICGPVKVELKD